MQRFKAYFGMVPPSDYEDDYLDDGTGQVRRVRGRGGYDDYYGQGFLRVETRTATTAMTTTRTGPSPTAVPRLAASGSVRRALRRGRARLRRREQRWVRVHRCFAVRSLCGSARLEPLQRSAGSTLCRRRASPPSGGHDADTIGDGQRITTLRPSSYSEARTIGERFRDGNPVIMDLVDMSNADAKRLVDLAAGPGRSRCAFDKVATKVFLLAPADIDVSPEDRRRIAETGFYSHS